MAEFSDRSEHATDAGGVASAFHQTPCCARMIGLPGEVDTLFCYGCPFREFGLLPPHAGHAAELDPEVISLIADRSTRFSQCAAEGRSSKSRSSLSFPFSRPPTRSEERRV